MRAWNPRNAQPKEVINIITPVSILILKYIIVFLKNHLFIYLFVSEPEPGIQRWVTGWDSSLGT